MDIKRTNSQEENGIKAVIYGDAGVGKTMLAKTIENVIILSSENGLLSLQDFDIPYIETSSLKSIDEAYKFLLKSDDAKKYDTVFIDSLSEIAEVSLNGHMRTCLTKDNKKDMRKAYNEMAMSTVAMVKRFRDLKRYNVVFTCKRKIIFDKDGDIVCYEPGVPGRILPFNVPYLMDELFCMQVDRKGQRFLQTSVDYKIPAKDRSGKLNTKEKADLDFIFNKIKGV